MNFRGVSVWFFGCYEFLIILHDKLTTKLLLHRGWATKTVSLYFGQCLSSSFVDFFITFVPLEVFIPVFKGAKIIFKIY